MQSDTPNGAMMDPVKWRLIHYNGASGCQGRVQTVVNDQSSSAATVPTARKEWTQDFMLTAPTTPDPGHPAATSVPTSSPTPAPAIIVQTLDFTDVTAQMAAEHSATYEVSYGHMLGLYDTAQAQFFPGCSVTSKVAARRAVRITFTVTVTPDKAETATSTVAMLAQSQPAELQDAFEVGVSIANTALQTNVAVPTVASASVPEFDANTTAPAENSSDKQMVIVVVCCALVGMVCLVAAALYCYFTQASGGDERRVAEDGKAYTATEFADFYGEAFEEKWAAAKPVETCSCLPSTTIWGRPTGLAQLDEQSNTSVEVPTAYPEHEPDYESGEGKVSRIDSGEGKVSSFTRRVGHASAPGISSRWGDTEGDS